MRSFVSFAAFLCLLASTALAQHTTIVVAQGPTDTGSPGETHQYYQLFEANNTPVTQRVKFNLLAGSNVTITASDNGVDTTTFTISASGSSGSGVNGPVSSTVGFIPTWSNTGGNILGAGIAAPAGAVVGTTDIQTLINKSIAASEITTGQLSIARGGTGTSTPALVAGSGIGISNSWPNNTLAATYNQGQTGAVTRNTAAKLAESVSVTDFGASNGGITDATTNIQSAVTAVCAAGGGWLYFPAGSYLVSSSTTIPCSMTVYGAARGAATVINKAGSLVGADFIVTANNVRFQDLTIDGNQANLGSAFRTSAWVSSSTYAKYNAVFNGTTSYIALQNVPASTAITNTAYWLPVLTLTSGQAAQSVNSGIGIEGRGNNLQVSNVEIMHEANWGVTMNSMVSGSLKGLLLEDVYFHDIGVAAQGNNTTQAGVENYNGTLSGVKIARGLFENIYSPTYGPGFSSAIFFVDASDVDIDGPTVINCLNARGGTVSADGDGTIVVNNVKYRGITVRQTVYLNQDGTSGIESDGANHVLIENNIFDKLPADAIHFGSQIANTPVTDYTVTGNSIVVSPTSTFLVSPDAAIQIGVPVSGTIGGVNGANVSNNTIDCQGVMPFGLFAPTTSSNIYGRGNRIKNCVFGELYDLSTTANILMPDYSWIGSDTATVTNTTALTKMYGLADYPLPWGALAYNGAVLKFQGGGFFSSPASAGTVALSLYVGSTQVCGFLPVTTPASTTTGSYSFSAQVTFFATGATYCSGGAAVFNGNSGLSSNTAITSAPITVTSGFNPYAAYGVDLGVQFSVASTSLNITNKSMSVALEYPGARNF